MLSSIIAAFSANMIGARTLSAHVGLSSPNKLSPADSVAPLPYSDPEQKVYELHLGVQ